MTQQNLHVAICDNCQSDVTKPFSMHADIFDFVGDFSTIDPRKLQTEICCPVPEGMAFHVKNHFYEQAIRLWLHPSSAIETLVLDRKLSVGCCGAAGRLNTRCACSALIGRIYLDCLGAHHFSPDPEFTSVIEYIEDEAERHLARHQRFILANRKNKKTRK